LRSTAHSTPSQPLATLENGDTVTAELVLVSPRPKHVDIPRYCFSCRSHRRTSTPKLPSYWETCGMNYDARNNIPGKNCSWLTCPWGRCASGNGVQEPELAASCHSPAPAILQRLPFSSAYHSPATYQRLPFSSAYHSLQRLQHPTILQLLCALSPVSWEECPGKSLLAPFEQRRYTSQTTLYVPSLVQLPLGIGHVRLTRIQTKNRHIYAGR
jgi:hypothetical protein